MTPFTDLPALKGWRDPNNYPGWIERFHGLIGMMDSIRRGEPPLSFNPHLIAVIPPTGQHAGPGWVYSSSSEQKSVPGNAESYGH
jgi:hypothetical protein